MRSWSSRFSRWTGSRRLDGEAAVDELVARTCFGFVFRSMCTLGHLHVRCRHERADTVVGKAQHQHLRALWGILA